MDKKQNFQTIPNQLKIQQLYNRFNIEQLIHLSRVNKQLKKTLEPIIRNKLKTVYKLDILNYNLLFNNLNKRSEPPDDPFVLEKIYDSYDNKSLFIRFLVKYMKIRAKSFSKKEEFLYRLQRRFHNSYKINQILENMVKKIHLYID